MNRLFMVATLLAGLAIALQFAIPIVQAGPTYQPPTNNVYVIHAGAYVDINTPIGASPGPADDAGSGAANCTLRDALGIVNAGTTVGPANGCTITSVGSPAGLVYRINLSTGGYIYTLDPANGELLITANTVYIVSDTAANTIIQASTVDPTLPGPPPGVATYRVLRNNGATIEMSHVTIRHGRCMVDMPVCAGMGNGGGGIYNQAGTMTVDASTISASTADYGGGVWNDDTLNVQNGSTIGGAGVGNQATTGGGGIHNRSGTVTVDASTVSANTAADWGGGISNWATLNVQNGSTIGGAGAGNQATNFGGGISNWYGTVTVDASAVSANTVITYGGGIWNDGTLNVQNGSTIGGAGVGNTARYGGGIFSDAGSIVTVVDASTVSANTAADQGGGIYNNQETLTVQNGSTIGGAGAGNQATAGGGIYSISGTTTVDGSTISANMATNGGGIYNDDATLNVQNGSIIGGAGVGNQADNNGGGIFNDEIGTTTVDSSTVSANTATNGGGIWNSHTLNVRNGSTIGGAGVGNQAFDGGGILNDSGGTVTVDASTVSANTATFGGGITNRATLNVQNGSTIGGAGAGNAAGTGGGIDNYAGTATLDGSAVSANRAIWGGGICNNATLNVQNGSTIGGAGAGNQAGWMGGGILNTQLGTTTVTDSRILNNTAPTPWGGGVYNDADTIGATSVTGSCIVGNSANSFHNAQAAQQTATGNWWGAATGPNTPCADTTGGNVDTTGFLAAPILGCPTGCPDLRVSKANDTGGNGTVGTAFNWTLTVTNPGGANATFNAGQRILVDDLPPGPTYGAPTPGNFTDITNPGNIHCTIAANTLTCDAQGGSVTVGNTTGRFDIVFSTTPNAAGVLNNPRGGGTCRVDPNDNVVESDETNNDCPANKVNIVAPPRPPSDDKDDEEEPTPVPPPKAQEFNCWPWLVIVPPGAAPNAVPGEWCQASLGKPLPAPSTFRYLGHSTEVAINDAAGNPIAKFTSPLKVCFHYTQPELDAVGGDPANFLLQVFLDGQWETLDTKPDSGLSYPGVCAPVDHLTLFALFARDGTASDTSAAAPSDSTLIFPTHLPETGELPVGLREWELAVAGVAMLLVGGGWLARCR